MKPGPNPRRNGPPPVVDTTVPDPPAILTGVALEVWNATILRLQQAGTWARIDAPAIARYSLLIARWRECEAILAREGRVYKTTNRGATRYYPRPEVAESKALSDQLLRLESAFGMNPASRPKVATNPHPDDELEKFLRGD